MKIRKRHRNFLIFHFWNLKLMLIDSALNSTSFWLILFKNACVVPRKAAKLENPAQILQKVIVFFPKRGEEIKPWVWNIWIAQWLKFSPSLVISFRFSPSTGKNGWSKFDQKRKPWIRLFFMETRILQPFFKQCCCLLEYYLWWGCGQYWTIFWGIRTQKSPKKGYFIDAESKRKTLKTFSSAITKTILMKLTTIMYEYKPKTS